MKNPLNKRLLREFKADWGKYLVIFLLLAGTISMISGFEVAANSLIIAYDNSFTNFNMENGKFRTVSELKTSAREAIEEEGDVKIYDNYYVDRTLENGSTLRIFANREEVDLVDLMSGELPTKEGEIALDRMYATNQEIAIGDTISDGVNSWKVTGLVALSDYSALFEDNNDVMFDADQFGVSVVTKEEFAAFDSGLLKYNYAWQYNNEPADDAEEKVMADDLVEVIRDHATLKDYTPRYLNQAITFTGEDLGSDSVMMVYLLYILIVIIAFVFGVLINNTISHEANQIGTLRASGYTKNEIIGHYMTLPMLVSLLAAVIGNILGYTVVKQVAVDLEYNSYSLPTYKTVWSGLAFVETTIVPIILLIVIDYFVLRKKMKLSPLKFLRRDLETKKQKKAFRLSRRIPFFSRFSLRVLFQNKSNYVVMFFGILFAYFLLFFGMAFPNVFENYTENIENNVFCNYTYMLTIPEELQASDSKLEELIAGIKFANAVETDNEDAESFSAYSLDTLEMEGIHSDSVLFYGIGEDSKYIDLDFSEDQIYVSKAYADKYEVKPGDEITLKEAYEDTEYTFKVDGISDYMGAVCVFMDKDYLNEAFDLGDDFYAGYFSDTEITDIDEKYIGSVIDISALTKVSRQMMISMGGMMKGVQIFSIIMFMILIYLLSKIVIEKNAQSISMTKILGYTNGEISRLYILSTTMVVIVSILLSMPIMKYSMVWMFKVMLRAMMSGWVDIDISPSLYPKMFVMGILTYVVVAAFEYGKVKKVPMDEALKNVE